MSELTHFHADIKAILAQARSQALSAVNAAMVEGVLADRSAHRAGGAAGPAQGPVRRAPDEGADHCPDGGLRQGVFLCQRILPTEAEFIAEIEREKRLIGGLDNAPLSAKPDDTTP